MSEFIGRKEELETLGTLYSKRNASLAVIRGRRRIGKSRLVEEFSRRYPFDIFHVFSGVPPTPSTTAQSQRDTFAVQLGHAFNLPGIKADDWSTLFLLLAERVKQGRVLVLFDEISWMGSKDPDFLGKLKNAWDWQFKKNDKLVLILCGSISAWIEKNILGSTGFVGRISLDLDLKELPLRDCNRFWGSQATCISAYEKLKLLAVTGGVPLYLEQLDPRLSAEENIRSLCFSPHGILFNEFEKLFSDLFSKRNEKYKKIIRCLANRPLEQGEIAKALDLSRSGDMGEYLEDLVAAGFVSRAHTWRIKEGMVSSLSQYRLCDNYARFYFKYIYPNRLKIENKQFVNASLGSLPGWNTVIGLQFENLVLNNKRLLWQRLKIQPEEIICDNPYFQRKTTRGPGCQIDYLVQVKYNSLYIVEIKFSKDEIAPKIIDEVQKKVSNLFIPKHFSYRPVLVQVNGVSEEVLDRGFFSDIINFGEMVNP